MTNPYKVTIEHTPDDECVMYSSVSFAGDNLGELIAEALNASSKQGPNLEVLARAVQFYAEVFMEENDLTQAERDDPNGWPEWCRVFLVGAVDITRHYAGERHKKAGNP